MATYLDIWEIRDKPLNNDFFLILGPKGAGKTAVGQYCRLRLEEQYGQCKVMSVSRDMEQLTPNISPLSALTSKLVSEEAQGVTAMAWRLYIALQLASLAIADQAGPLARTPGFRHLWKELQRAGLVSEHTVTADLPTVLRRVREGKMSFSAKVVGGEALRRDTDEISVTQLGDTPLDALFAARSDTHYQLTIDGLDRVIGSNRAYWLSVSSLLMAASDIHMRIRTSRSNIHLMVMCRTDVFRRVGSADADKIAGDSALFVDWANQQTRIEDSYLWDYLAAKAGITIDDLMEILPEHVTVGASRGSSGRRLEGVPYFFSSTRCTPREMTMLMRRVQSATPAGQAVTGERLRIAVDNFASQDLLSILMAESSGILPPESRDALPAVIGGLPRASHVEFSDLRESAQTASLDATAAKEIAEFLFLAGVGDGFRSGHGGDFGGNSTRGLCDSRFVARPAQRRPDRGGGYGVRCYGDAHAGAFASCGVGEVVGSLRDDDLRDAASERGQDGAGAAMADHGGAPVEQQALRHEALDAGVGRDRLERLWVIVLTDGQHHGELIVPEPVEDGAEHVVVGVEHRAEGDIDERTIRQPLEPVGARGGT